MQSYRPNSIPAPGVVLREINGQLGVYTTKPIERGACVVALAHVFTDKPARYTIQLAANRHQAGTNEIDDYFNHSCDPNCYLDVETLSFRALRRLEPGEQLTFNYLTSEWDMESPFHCWCQAPSCTGTIRGFSHLSRHYQRALEPQLTPYLRGKMEEVESDVA